METETKAYLDSLLYLKTVTPNAVTETEGIIQVYKNFILEERKPEQVGEDPPAHSVMQNYNNARMEAVMMPRLITVSGYQGLFDEALQNSKLRR